jgi:hypothetical protein
MRHLVLALGDLLDKILGVSEEDSLSPEPVFDFLFNQLVEILITFHAICVASFY